MMLKLIVGFLFCQLMVEALKLPMTKTQSKGLKFLKEGNFPEFRKWKLNRQQTNPNPINDFKNGGTKIGRTLDGSYQVKVSFGTPPQTFNFALDFDFSSVFVFDRTAVDAKNKSYCDHVQCFNSNLSSTYIDDGRQFEDIFHTEIGYYGTDILRLGNQNDDPLVLPNITFTQLTYFDGYHGEDYVANHFDGSLELGFDSVDSISYEITPIVTQILETFDNQIFTVWVNGSRGVDFPEGQLTFGNTDEEHCSDDIFYVSNTADNYYGFTATAFEVGNRKRIENVIVGLDIGNLFTTVTPNALRDIVKVTNANFDSEADLYFVKCDVKFEFSIYIENKKLTIDESVGVIKERNVCYLAFEKNLNSETYMNLGQPFAQKYCYTIDMTRNMEIGIATNLD